MLPRPFTAPPAHFGRATLDRHRHICAFFHSPEEEDATMIPFFKEGIEAGEQALCIVDPAESAEYRQRLSNGGINVAAAEKRGQLICPTWHDTYLQNGRFEPAAMLATVDRVIQERKKAGYSCGRFAGHMEWADPAASLDLIEYESSLNELLPSCPDTVVCLYQVGRHDGSVIMDVLRTHPLAMVGGIVYENPFYLPPSEFLIELRQRRAARDLHVH
jgi:hypothetical protein